MAALTKKVSEDSPLRFARPKPLLIGRDFGPSMKEGSSAQGAEEIMRDDLRESRRQRGIAMVLLSRLDTQRLPYALRLKKKVDAGELLTEFDTAFLKQVFSESSEARRLVEKQPQYREIVDKMTSLYEEIVRKGAENQRKAT